MKSGDFTRLLETEVSFWMLKRIIHGVDSLAVAEFCGLAAKMTGDPLLAKRVGELNPSHCSGCA